MLGIRRSLTGVAVAVTAAVSVAVSVTPASQARADVVADVLAAGVPAEAGPAAAGGAFYDPPSRLPRHNGAIIRSERSRFTIDPTGLEGLLVSAQRIMYRSTDHDGRRSPSPVPP